MSVKGCGCDHPLSHGPGSFSTLSPRQTPHTGPTPPHMPSGMDKLLCFMTVREVQNFVKFIDRVVLSGVPPPWPDAHGVRGMPGDRPRQSHGGLHISRRRSAVVPVLVPSLPFVSMGHAQDCALRGAVLPSRNASSGTAPANLVQTQTEAWTWTSIPT